MKDEPLKEKKALLNLTSEGIAYFRYANFTKEISLDELIHHIENILNVKVGKSIDER